MVLCYFLKKYSFSILSRGKFMSDSPVYKQSPISSQTKKWDRGTTSDIRKSFSKRKKGTREKKRDIIIIIGRNIRNIWEDNIFLIPFFILSYFAFFCALDDCAVRGFFFFSGGRTTEKRAYSFLHISYHSGVSISFFRERAGFFPLCSSYIHARNGRWRVNFLADSGKG